MFFAMTGTALAQSDYVFVLNTKKPTGEAKAASAPTSRANVDGPVLKTAENVPVKPAESSNSPALNFATTYGVQAPSKIALPNPTTAPAVDANYPRNKCIGKGMEREWALNWVLYPGQKRKYYDAREAVDNYLDSSSVRIFEPVGEIQSRAVFRIVVLNNGKRDVDFGLEDIDVQSTDGTSVSIIPYAQLVSETRKKYGWRTALLNVGNALSISASGNVYDTGSVNFSGTTTNNASFSGATINGSHFSGTATGTGHFSGTANYSVFNSAASAASTEAAYKRAEKNNEELSRRKFYDMETVKSNIRTVTIDSGNTLDSNFTVDIPRKFLKQNGASELRFVIQVGEDRHVFSAEILKPC